MAKENTEIKVEINGVPDLKSIPKAVLEPVVETLLANMLEYFKKEAKES
ncbi:MAG: hypothetical protein IJZ73_05275 [Clostridia bacterium]|nr:hypothetical protein [Clostridia bacterium]MBQ8197453.1 hypothetical protein [Clostridia bacterium]